MVSISNKNTRFKENKSTQNYQNKKMTKVCYKCGKEGHISYHCSLNQKGGVNAIRNLKLDNHFRGQDVRQIIIEGKERSVLFDTGATESMIGRGALLGVEHETI